MEIKERTAVTIDHLYDHIVLAAAHYHEVLDHQFSCITHFSPVWNKEKMWENYYTPICNELEEMWDLKMNGYLETLR